MPMLKQKLPPVPASSPFLTQPHVALSPPAPFSPVTVKPFYLPLSLQILSLLILTHSSFKLFLLSKTAIILKFVTTAQLLPKVTTRSSKLYKNLTAMVIFRKIPSKVQISLLSMQLEKQLRQHMLIFSSILVNRSAEPSQTVSFTPTTA